MISGFKVWELPKLLSRFGVDYRDNILLYIYMFSIERVVVSMLSLGTTSRNVFRCQELLSACCLRVVSVLSPWCLWDIILLYVFNFNSCCLRVVSGDKILLNVFNFKVVVSVLSLCCLWRQHLVAIL